MKKLLKPFILLFIIITTGCNNDQEDNIPIVTAKNPKDIAEQIAHANSVNSRLDKELNESFLKELSERKFLKNDKLTKEEKIQRDLENYHKQVLLKIQKSRKELNLTSIQSIADEINSLFVINKEKANTLFKKNKHLLKKSMFGVTPNIPRELASVLDVNSDLLNDEKLDDINIITKGPYESIKHGILCTTGPYAITWHASILHIGGFQYSHQVAIGSFVMYKGKYHLYPSTIDVKDDSHFDFFGINERLRVKFKSGNSFITKGYIISNKPYYYLHKGYIKGHFETIINNEKVYCETARTIGLGY